MRRRAAEDTVPVPGLGDAIARAREVREAARATRERAEATRKASEAAGVQLSDDEVVKQQRRLGRSAP
ncbi:hypothetical protein A5709_03975 [Mycobacterium sp. E1386]|nr:hypothetical protein A5709_03975 [Mycobacterium sp. E1386]